ncbi:universal stress protein [Almyronema epifaneia]|uniref:Universal stress protein n=1 Tax=Almyronema epifaneia S1 TaxID=2991925 RepID=A0ABW6IAA5_9CYAN
MIKNILVALDDDDTCQRVFDQTIELAHPLHANLHLLNVLMPERDDSVTQAPYSDKDWKMYADRYRELKIASLKLLENLADTAKTAGVNAEVTQAFGTPGPVICQLAKTWGADLIMVGSHGRRGLSEMLLGSVSNYVVHHAACSVMVVHEPA